MVQSEHLGASNYREPEYVQERLREIKAKMERDGRQPCTTCAICLEDFPEGAMDKEQGLFLCGGLSACVCVCCGMRVLCSSSHMCGRVIVG